MSYQVKFTDSSAQDYRKLDNSQKKQVLKSLLKIEQNGLNVGEQLKGKLKDCRKLKHKRLGLRIIFKEGDLGMEIIEIVVIGKRAGNDVYKSAEKRLNR